MKFMDFLIKHKKLLIILLIIICAIVLGVFTTQFWGGLTGLIGIAWGLVIGKKPHEPEEYKKTMKHLNERIESLQAESTAIEKDILAGTDRERELRNEIERTKKDLAKMTLSDKIREHNKMIGEIK